MDLNTGELRIIETKKHKSRNIVMSDEMNSLAKSYAAVRDAAFPESEFFFPSPSGGPYSAGWMQGKFKRFFALSKPDVPKDLLPSVRVYDFLRHSHASLLVEMGFTPLAIAERLGHEKIETTLNTYSHLYPNKQGELADKLEIENSREEEE